MFCPNFLVNLVFGLMHFSHIACIKLSKITLLHCLLHLYIVHCSVLEFSAHLAVL